jgi:hypothetical protein
MKLIDVESKATLEDFLTLKKTELLQFLLKCNKKTQCYQEWACAPSFQCKSSDIWC